MPFIGHMEITSKEKCLKEEVEFRGLTKSTTDCQKSCMYDRRNVGFAFKQECSRDGGAECVCLKKMCYPGGSSDTYKLFLSK